MTDYTEPNTDFGTEVALVHGSRTVDLRDRNTDSWTDVLDEAITLARGICTTEFVPKGLRGSVEKVTAAVLYSRELGLPPMTGLGATHIIEGKAGISAEMMRALVLQAGHELAIRKCDRSVCEIAGRRKGSTEWTVATWTIQEAHQTKVFISKDKGWQPLSTKSNWQSWPSEMLLARATTRLVRMIFPDVAQGMRSSEELQDMSVEVEVVGQAAPVEAEPVKRRRVTRPAPRAATAATPSEPADEASDAGPAPEDAAPAPVAAEPVQRQRMARPAPRGTTPPAQAPAAAAVAPVPTPAPTQAPTVVDELPAEDDIPDAEVVSTTDPVDEKRKIITYAVLQFERLGVNTREERIFLTSELIGRKVTSTNELTYPELRTMSDQLGRSRDLRTLQALIDQQHVDAETTPEE